MQLRRYLGGASQLRGVFFGRIWLEVVGLQLFEPCVFVGRKHTERTSGLCQNLAAFENALIFGGLKQDACMGQMPQYLGVAHQSIWFIVMVCKDRLHTQRGGDTGYRMHRIVMGCQQWRRIDATDVCKLLVQVCEASVNERHAPV